MEYLIEFNDPASPYRVTLLRTVINRMDFTLADLTEESISFLLRLLHVEQGRFALSVLSKIVTRQFISDRLLPLWKESKGMHRQYLYAILVQAGHNHGCRYVHE